MASIVRSGGRRLAAGAIAGACAGAIAAGPAAYFDALVRVVRGFIDLVGKAFRGGIFRGFTEKIVEGSPDRGHVRVPDKPVRGAFYIGIVGTARKGISCPGLLQIRAVVEIVKRVACAGVNMAGRGGIIIVQEGGAGRGQFNMVRRAIPGLAFGVLLIVPACPCRSSPLR